MKNTYNLKRYRMMSHGSYFLIGQATIKSKLEMPITFDPVEQISKFQVVRSGFFNCNTTAWPNIPQFIIILHSTLTLFSNKSICDSKFIE